VTAVLTGVGASARDAWRQVLPLDPAALVSQTPTWMDCVCASGPYEDATRAYATADGQQLILPLARRRLPVSVAASMPFGWSTGGLISSRGVLTAEDVAGVVRDLVSQHALLIGVKPSPAMAPLWANSVPSDVTRTRHMTHTVDLSGGFDAVWKRCAGSVRSRCRQAERKGVTVERDDTGRLMPVFYSLYRKSVERWAHQQHEPLWLARWRARRRDPWEKFQAVAQRLGPCCRVWVAWRAGEPLAAEIVLVHGQHAMGWRAAMDKDAARRTGAPQLLVCRALEEACEAGQRFFYLGESAPSSGLARIKRDYGGEETYYAGYRFERLPLTAADRFVRRQVKGVIGFRD
jgi:CelD/BcsL family acetyltransferase involved in cellulose biosynthesis